MEQKISEIEINGVKYIAKDSITELAIENGLQYVVVRADRAGVFSGYLKEKLSDQVTLTNVRRLWYWDGAASCSDLARKGVSKPTNCKFTAPISEATIKNWIEILPATQEAKKSLEGVTIWQA